MNPRRGPARVRRCWWSMIRSAFGGWSRGTWKRWDWRWRRSPTGWRPWAGCATRTYGLVVTDLEMPRLDGFELLAEMQRLRPLAAIPVIVVSTRVDQETRRRVLAWGPGRFFPSPSTRPALAGAMAPLLVRASGLNARGTPWWSRHGKPPDSGDRRQPDHPQDGRVPPVAGRLQRGHGGRVPRQDWRWPCSSGPT